MPAWFARIIVLCLALASLAWGCAMLPLFWRSRPIEATADLIVQGHQFSTSDIEAELRRMESYGTSPKASVRRSLAMLKLRLVEDAFAQGDRLSIDRRFGELNRSVVELFEVDPADSFFWMIYYWSQVTTGGFTPATLKALEFSYDLGPNEGWIGIKRNRVALGVMSQLSERMKQRVVDEFAGMVAAGLIVDAAASINAASEPTRSRLLAGLGSAPIAERERLARYLGDTGTDVEIPGVHLPEKRFY